VWCGVVAQALKKARKASGPKRVVHILKSTLKRDFI